MDYANGTWGVKLHEGREKTFLYVSTVGKQGPELTQAWETLEFWPTKGESFVYLGFSAESLKESHSSNKTKVAQSQSYYKSLL